MKSFLLPALAAVVLAGASFDTQAHSNGHGDRRHGPPAYGHGVPPGHRKHHGPSHHGHYRPAHHGPVVVVQAPRYGYYPPPVSHRHYADCGHQVYYRTPPSGVAFGITPYGSWVDIRLGY